MTHHSAVFNALNAAWAAHTRKLRDLGADLGGGMRGFKDAMREGAENKDA